MSSKESDKEANQAAPATVESDKNGSNPLPSILEPVTATSSSKLDFFGKLLSMLADWLLATIQPLLIIIKNTIIFWLFLEADGFILGRITVLLSDNKKIAIVNTILQGITISSAVIIGVAYVVRLAVELIRHREEYLGIAQGKAKQGKD